MRISDVLKGKGDSSVATIRTDADLTELLAVLAGRGIGAVVVSDDGSTIAGIVSERDIVRRLADKPDSLHAPVRDIMTAEVITCTPETTVEILSGEMTEHRIRHIPVVKEGRMVGLVSIGDVVKHRIGQLQAEAEHLAGYINQ